MKFSIDVLKESLILSILLGIFKFLSYRQHGAANYLQQAFLDFVVFFLFVFIGRTLFEKFKNKNSGNH